MSTHAAVTSTCLTVIQNVLGTDSAILGDAIHLHQLDLDSLDTVDILQQLEQHYDIYLDVYSNSGLDSLEDIVQKVMDALSVQRPANVS